MKLYVLLIYLAHITDGLAMTTLGLLPDEVNIPKTCTMERVYKMVGYVCSNLNLKEIPQHLRSSFEVLDVSFNRIRELDQNSFSRYTDIKYLYLFENMIQIIEKNTFAQLTSLEAIDLSTNGLTTLPMDLFSLPSLRHLHASDNSLIHLHNDLKNLSKPVVAPLRLINVASCRLSKIPDFGVLPDLWQLNISSNDLFDITTQQLSPYCGLISIDVNNTKIPPCPCTTLVHYFRKRSITTPNGIHCDTSAEELIYCSDTFNSTLDSDDYERCTSLQKDRKLKEKSKWTWMSVFGGLLGFFVIFMGMLYIFHRRNVRMIRESEQITKLKQIHQTDKNQTVELLLERSGVM